MFMERLAVFLDAKNIYSVVYCASFCEKKTEK